MSSQRQRAGVIVISSSESEDYEEETSESDNDDDSYEESDDDDDDSYEASDVTNSSDGASDEEEDRSKDSNNDEESLCKKVVCCLKEGSDLRGLTVDECKVYLRKNGLRLSGSKAVCIERIKEHWRIRDGNGEALYPTSSFVVDCTGDVCQGDTVLFTQKVHEKFDKVKRHGRVLGRRTVAGRVVHESYGAAKQQHTFTIEVLWSKGIRKLPPLFPLLVKGRNLYRLRTSRQLWKNESERVKILDEKHKRGSVARSVRALRKQKNAKPAGEGRKCRKHPHEAESSHVKTTTNRGKHATGVQKPRPQLQTGKVSHRKHEAPPGIQHLNLNTTTPGSHYSGRHENFHQPCNTIGPGSQSYRPLHKPYQSQTEFYHNYAPSRTPNHNMSSTSTMTRAPHFNPYTDTYPIPTSQWYVPSRFPGHNHDQHQ